MKLNKKGIKANKRISFFRSRPAIAKIEVEENGRRVFRFKGNLNTAWKEFKKLCINVYQFGDEEIDLDFKLDGIEQLEGLKNLNIPQIPLLRSDKNE